MWTLCYVIYYTICYTVILNPYFWCTYKTYNGIRFTFEKLVLVATDGAPALGGILKGIVPKLKDNCPGKNNYSLKHLHYANIVLKSFKYVLKTFTKIVNYIRAHGVNHRQFIKFLVEIGSEYPDLPNYTEIRWLPNHRVLKRSYKLLYEIVMRS